MEAYVLCWTLMSTSVCVGVMSQRIYVINFYLFSILYCSAEHLGGSSL